MNVANLLFVKEVNMNPIKNNIIIDWKKELDAHKIALDRERQAREQAEQILEKKSYNLFKINQRLQEQYVNASRRTQEVDYLYRITNLEIQTDIKKLFSEFLEISSMLIWADASFAFKVNSLEDKLEPVANFIINADDNKNDEINDDFVNENFDFLNIHMDCIKPIRFSGFLKDMIKLNSRYQGLNFSYIFPFRVGHNESYLIWFTFSNAKELEARTLNLIESGLHQMLNTMIKFNSKIELEENFRRLKEVKSQLIQSEKMASLGTISAGIAHEINNPLSFLLTNSEVMKEYISSVINYINSLEKMINFDSNIDLKKEKNEIDFILQDTPMLMNESLEGIERIKQIVSGLKTFSRADDGIAKSFTLNECVESSLRLVSNELKHKSKVFKKLSSIHLIKGADGQIIQVLTNLLVNSAQAIDEFGEISIETYDDDQFAFVKVSDNGKGISQENLKQLFTPFFTTKPTGQGTGLGLSISYGIIKKHSGEISVESTEGVGTSFLIKLPKV